MKKHKFHNETFELKLTLCLWDSSKEKSNKQLTSIMDKIGYDRSETDDHINNSRAFVGGKMHDAYIFFDTNGFQDYKGKNRKLRMIRTLAHECTHVKENVLDQLGEKVEKRETECSQRITDWCFTKCMSTKFFKSMLK